MKYKHTIYVFLITLLALSFILSTPFRYVVPVSVVFADAGGDSGSDAGGDSGSDAGGDSGSDAGGDSGSDAGGDSGSDAGGDSGAGVAEAGGETGGGGETPPSVPPSPPGAGAPSAPPAPPGDEPPTPPSPPGGGGGSSSGGPGGLNAPNVVLLPGAQSAPFAFVTLSQIPYTGFEAGPIEQIIYWGLLILWSAFIAYLFSVKRLGAKMLEGLRKLVSFSLSAKPQELLESVSVRADFKTAPHISISAPDTGMVVEVPDNLPLLPPLMKKLVPEPLRAQAPVPPPVRTETERKIETTAHENSCLLSKEACVFIANSARGEEDEAVALVSRVVEEGKKVFPKEDGWLLLNKERVSTLLSKAPESVTTIPLFIGWLMEGKREKAFDYLRALSLRGESTTHFITQVAAELDRAYRARVELGAEPDPYTREKTSHLAPREILAFVEMLVDGIDGIYSSGLTGVKLAVSRALATFSKTTERREGASGTEEREAPQVPVAAPATAAPSGFDEFLYAQIHKTKHA